MNSIDQKIKCIGIIMDGNRRWAKNNGKMSFEGHKEGYRKLKEVLGWIKEKGIDEAVVYAFSTENWKRAEEEVGSLMKLLSFALSNEIDSLLQQGVRLKFAGDISRLPESLQKDVKNAELKTEKNGPLTLTVALSYGGRADILQAVKRVSQLPKADILSLDEKTFGKYLWTGEMNDPDLIIRTGGEIRVSNFILYQCAYSEFFFTKTLWPDFSHDEFEQILREFSERKRNCGR
jgi:undecaprenyl diphosphate synthase